jgi:hypothetical protein
MIAQVISLPWRPDRRQEFAVNADAAGVQYEFVDAVDGRDGVVDGWHGTAGAYGCAASHARVLNSGTGELLVFEDDAVIPVDFNERLAQFRSTLPPNWGLMKLGGEHVVPPSERMMGRVRCNMTMRTHAYLVSAGSRADLGLLAGVVRIDWDGPYATFPGSYAPDPMLVPVSGSPSDITGSTPC